MAKKTKKKPAPKQAAPARAAPKVDRQVIPLISEKDFASVHKRITAAKTEARANNSSIGGIVSDAVERKHLHKGAYGIVARIDSMTPKKRSELLYAFDHMRDLLDWDDQLDLFKAQASESVAETADSDVDHDVDGDDEHEFEEDDPPKVNGRGREAPPSI
jgi:hypothetical protein